MKTRIYYDDTDAQGIVYHANYLKFCERARSEFIFSSFGKDAFSSTSFFVVAAINAKFKGSARLGDMIEVRSKCLKITDISALLEQEILLDDKVIFSAEVKVVYLSNGELARIPNEYQEILAKLS